MRTNLYESSSLRPLIWAGGFEDTFIPQSRPGLRSLDEYELTQHYEQWREDLDRAASLGITTMRWGVPWYRVEPQPGAFDWAWIDAVLTYMVNDLHIQPIVDLMHYGTPLWLEDSFVNPGYPERVAAYTGAFAKRYQNLVRYYTPLNEPTVNADYCGKRGVWPPYLTGERGYLEVLLAIARGIQLSAQAIRAADPDAVLVAVEAMNWSHPATPQAQQAATRYDQLNFLCWDLVSGRVDATHPLYEWLLTTGITEKRLEGLRELPTVHEILGVNFYPWSARDIVIDEAGKVQTRGVPRDGRLLADVLRRCYTHAQQPLFVTETSAREDISGRAAWMDETIAAVEMVRAEGIPVIGYTWFPLITMIDWQYRLTEHPIEDYLMHLGLWDAHFNERGVLVRQETPLVEKYRSYIRR
jgi:beta-glucosidase